MSTMSNNTFKLIIGEKKGIVERKKELRAHMKKRRALTDNKDVKEDLMLDNFFQALREAGKENAERFFVYMSYSSEARTDKLIAALQAQGKKVYAPCVDGQEMTLIEIGEDFSLSDMGIREPIGEAYEGEMDVAVMPLLAVDEQGNRLGYGGGYYDRYLQKHPEVMTIGYAYDTQVIEEVPSEPWDKKIQIIVTDKRVLRTKK